jgi:hypothetical protein
MPLPKTATAILKITFLVMRFLCEFQTLLALIHEALDLSPKTKVAQVHGNGKVTIE